MVNSLQKFYKFISTHLLTVEGAFRLVSQCAVSACFTGLAAYSVICLGSSKVVILRENGVVNGVPDEWQEGVLGVSDFRF